MYDTDTISAMASGLGEALADGVEPIYSESYHMFRLEEEDAFSGQLGRFFLLPFPNQSQVDEPFPVQTFEAGQKLFGDDDGPHNR